jgi:hypothetical protein
MGALFGTLNPTLMQCVLAMSFFNMKMSDATVKGHNNGAVASAITNFYFYFFKILNPRSMAFKTLKH